MTVQLSACHVELFVLLLSELCTPARVLVLLLLLHVATTGTGMHS